jgi:uncharacterized protein YlxW (UPF0749 family)
MDNKFTMAVIIAVLCAAVAGVFGYRLSVRTNEKAALEQQVATLQEENRNLQSRFEQLTAANATLQHDYEGVKAEYEALQAKHGKPATAAATH